MTQQITVHTINGLFKASNFSFDELREPTLKGNLFAGIQGVKSPIYLVTNIDEEISGNFYITFLPAGKGKKKTKVQIPNGLAMIPVETAYLKEQDGRLNMEIETDNPVGITPLDIKLSLVTMLPVQTR